MLVYMCVVPYVDTVKTSSTFLFREHGEFVGVVTRALYSISTKSTHKLITKCIAKSNVNCKYGRYFGFIVFHAISRRKKITVHF